MTRLRVGLVGSGWAAGAHLGAHSQIDDCEVVAICTSRAPVPPEFTGRDGSPLEVVRDFADLIARDDIDVIDICSRSDQHAAQAIAAAQAGKHLIIEKPIGLDLADMRAVEAAVKAAGVRTCVCLQVRFGQQFTATKGLVDGDLIGPIHYAEVDYNHHIGPEVGQYEWNLRRDGGGSTLLTAGCHALDGLLMFMGNDITEVTSYETVSTHPNFAPYEYADLVRDGAALRERRHRQGGLGGRLAPAVLPARVPRRPGRDDPRRQALVGQDRRPRPRPLDRARHQARERDRGHRRRLHAAVPGVLRRASTATARWSGRASPTPCRRSRSCSRPTGRPPRAAPSR